MARCRKGRGGAATLALWAQAAGDWPLWSIPAVWGPLALLALASMTAFVIAAPRGVWTKISLPARGRTRR